MKNKQVDTGFYIFNSKDVCGQSLIHLINLYLPKNFIAAEVGTDKAQTSCTIAQNCLNLKKIYAIDSYLPYENNNGPSPIGEKESDHSKIIAKHNIEFSGVKEKIELMELDCMSSLKMFEDNSLDLIFYDINLDYNTSFNYLSEWYKKLKPGGIFSGHCWNVLQVPILELKNNENNNNLLSIYDNVWAWIK